MLPEKRHKLLPYAFRARDSTLAGQLRQSDCCVAALRLPLPFQVLAAREEGVGARHGHDVLACHYVLRHDVLACHYVLRLERAPRERRAVSEECRACERRVLGMHAVEHARVWFQRVRAS